jgi:23S rRNA maturation mini-RNase III
MAQLPPGALTPIPDVLPAFDAMVFQQGLKQSSQALYRQLPGRLRTIAVELQRCLAARDPVYGVLRWESMAAVCVDNSMVGRPEFSVQCASNRLLAYVGDALLSLILARRSYRLNRNAEEHQKERSLRTSTEHLHRFYVNLFGTHQVFLSWEAVSSPNHQPSARQASQFLEALIGFLHEAGYPQLAERLSEAVLDFPPPPR